MSTSEIPENLNISSEQSAIQFENGTVKVGGRTYQVILQVGDQEIDAGNLSKEQFQTIATQISDVFKQTKVDLQDLHGAEISREGIKTNKSNFKYIPPAYENQELFENISQSVGRAFQETSSNLIRAKTDSISHIVLREKVSQTVQTPSKSEQTVDKLINPTTRATFLKNYRGETNTETLLKSLNNRLGETKDAEEKKEIVSAAIDWIKDFDINQGEFDKENITELIGNIYEQAVKDKDTKRLARVLSVYISSSGLNTEYSARFDKKLEEILKTKKSPQEQLKKLWDPETSKELREIFLSQYREYGFTSENLLRELNELYSQTNDLNVKIAIFSDVTDWVKNEEANKGEFIEKPIRAQIETLYQKGLIDSADEILPRYAMVLQGFLDVSEQKLSISSKTFKELFSNRNPTTEEFFEKIFNSNTSQEHRQKFLEVHRWYFDANTLFSKLNQLYDKSDIETQKSILEFSRNWIQDGNINYGDYTQAEVAQTITNLAQRGKDSIELSPLAKDIEDYLVNPEKQIQPPEKPGYSEELAGSQDVTDIIKKGVRRGLKSKRYAPAVKLIADELYQLDLYFSSTINPLDFTKGGSGQDTALQANTQHFNYISYFVAEQILESVSEKSITTEIQVKLVDKSERRLRIKRTISFFLDVAQNLKERGDIVGYQAVIAGLNQSSIHRLEEAWDDVRHEKKKRINEYDELMKKSNAGLRQLTKSFQDQPITPPFNVTKSDTTFIQEGNPRTKGEVNINILDLAYNSHKDVKNHVDRLRSYVSTTVKYKTNLITSITKSSYKNFDKDSYARSLEIRPRNRSKTF